MHYIKSVEIDGFWGRKNVKVDFNHDLNFIIGPNGTGKTTVINLIVAVLRADIKILYSIRFTRIKLRMRDLDSRKIPIIIVEKNVDPTMGNIQLVYHIRSSTTSEANRYVVEGPEEERLYNWGLFESTRPKGPGTGARLEGILSNLIEINWLSVHRGGPKRSRNTLEIPTQENSVDLKLDEIASKFPNYFSLMSSQADQQNKIFQESVFLSLLRRENPNEVLRQANIAPVDKEIVLGVLDDLGVAKRKASREVSSHYRRLKKGQDEFKNEAALTITTAVLFSDAKRLRDVASEWRNLVAKREEIFKPRTNFEEIMNSLLSGKKLEFDQRNLPNFRLASGDYIDIATLSSGEKQLFILLGEALLQEKRPVVFLSDEPELSLHVKWQSTLFQNILKINPASQIITATHSPDIVGPFQDKIIEIEECIDDVY